jgi:SAM-dependent methyltransferase
VLPIPRFDPGEGVSLRDLGKGLRELLAAGGHDPNVAALLREGRTQRADLSKANLPGALSRDMDRHGLLVNQGSLVTLPFQIRLVDDSIIVTDRRISNWRAEEHYVDPLWGAPNFNKLLVRGPARRALDLGCGCGVMTLAAAKFCDQVIGVDVNPRAVAISRFNVALNGVDNVQIAHSDLFEAVRGQRFERIVFNSPTGFELRPRTRLEAGEQILERFFSELLGHLEEDGYAQLYLCFMDRRRSTFWERLNSWLDGNANQLQIVLFERFRIDRGLRFFADRLLVSLRDRSNGFDVTSVSQGWLVLKRGESLAVRVPLNYKELSQELSADFGDVLVRSLFGSHGRIALEELEKRQIARPEVLADSLGRMKAIEWS